MITEYNLEEILKDEKYKGIIPTIIEDTKYELARKTTDKNLPEELYKEIRDNDKFEKYVIPNMNETKKEHLNAFITSEIVNYFICHENFDLSYEDYKFLKEADISKLQFSDQNLKLFITNIKEIQNGNYEIFSKREKNIRERLLEEFKQEFNNGLINCNNLPQIENEELKVFGLEIPNNISVKSSGVNFKMLIKDLGYSRRNNVKSSSKYDYWNAEEYDFKFDSRSLVSNSLFTTINNSLAPGNWCVGFNQVSKLNNASSSDLAQKTDEYGNLNSYLKPGGNTIGLSTSDQILAETGIISENNIVHHNYNEIVCNKYDELMNKEQPSYIVFTVSSNKNSKFSENIKGRFETAKEAAQEFKVPIVVVNLDKIIRNEKEVVNQKIEEYKKTKDPILLEDILTQIKMNRVTDYGDELFTNDFIADFITQNYNKETSEIFNKMISKMPNFTPHNIKSRNENIKKGFDSLIKYAKVDELSKINTFEEIKDFLSKNDLQKLDELESKLKKESSKFFKTKKIKKEIENIQLEMDIFKEKLINEENTARTYRISYANELITKYNIPLTANEHLREDIDSYTTLIDQIKETSFTYEEKINVPKVEEVIVVKNQLIQNNEMELEHSRTY